MFLTLVLIVKRTFDALKSPAGTSIMLVTYVYRKKINIYNFMTIHEPDAAQQFHTKQDKLISAALLRNKVIICALQGIT